MGLEEYRRRRDFGRTPEPLGDAGAGQATASMGQFVVQKHAARRLHYDFRLELDGVLKSWAVPKGPSLQTGERRMAVETEDHPLEYGGFEGIIPKGEYGGGTVAVWDRGRWLPSGDPRKSLAAGKLDFVLFGEKLRGRWHLVRSRRDDADRGRPYWLLIKGRDDQSRPGTGITETAPNSVLSGRDLDAIARDADRVWSSEHGELPDPSAPRPVDLSKVPGARVEAFPTTVEPQLAMLVDRPPEGEDWLHEVKLDGYRLQCRIEDGRVVLRSRNGLDWTERFASLVGPLRKLPARSALLDGEAVVLDSAGRTAFQALQRSFGEGRTDAITYTIFDCLYLDGYDFRATPLIERKRVLQSLLANAEPASPLRYGDHVVGNGPAFLEAACGVDVEGIVSKRRDGCYHAGRHPSWLKIKCLKRQELLIVGFTDPKGSRYGFGALLMAAHDARGALRYCGKVGTGFDERTLRELRARFEPLVRRTPPVVAAPRERGLHWIEPVLVAEVSFADWTRDGRARHPTFLGLREDKSPEEVRIEEPQHTSRITAVASTSTRRVDEAAAQGVRITTPGRVYYPEIGLTKRDLIAYYEAVAPRALPGLVQRPLTLLRCPEGHTGECFYQKRADRTVPAAVSRVLVKEGRAPYAMVTDLASLVSLVQIGVLELHVWGARVDRLDRPDLLVFDLDPDPAVPWGRVIETAQVLRSFLSELGLVAFVRLTGGKGLHVVTPLVRRSTWDEAKGFSHGIARSLERLAPGQLTAQMAKAHRTNRIFLDTFRNAPEATAIASYSVRARPGAPVALPIAWDELGSLSEPLRLDPAHALTRIERAPDPWADFEKSRRPITREAIGRLW